MNNNTDYDTEAFKTWRKNKFPKSEKREDISVDGLNRWAAKVRQECQLILYTYRMEQYWEGYRNAPSHIRRNMMPPFVPILFID